MITIFTDGSSKGNPGPGGWGGIVAHERIKNDELRITNEEWITELGGKENHTTNNRMELTACIQALQFIIHNSKFIIQPVTLYTDSEYVLKGITLWIHNWQKKGWKTASKKPVENQDLWQELLKVTEGKDIEWKIIRGHAGIPANERCDVIATTFADSEKPILYDGPRKDYRVSLKV
ncbi:MAG: ribonuclease HI [Minisyncoccota bacterium]